MAWDKTKVSELWPGEVIKYNEQVYRIAHIEYGKTSVLIYTYDGGKPLFLSTEDEVWRA